MWVELLEDHKLLISSTSTSVGSVIVHLAYDHGHVCELI